MGQFLDQLSLRLNYWVEYLVAAMGMSMAAIVGAQVFSRYALNHSLFWSEEAARYLLVWLTFLGTSIAYRKKVHPGVDLFFVRMNTSFKTTSLLLVHLVSLCFFAMMMVYGGRFAWFVRNQTSPALGIPKWIILAIIPISGLVLAIHCLAFLNQDVRGDAGDA